MLPEHLNDGGPRVRLIGDHPHQGATGTCRDDLPLVQGMWRIELDPGAPVEACFAGQEHLRGLPLEEDPFA